MGRSKAHPLTPFFILFGVVSFQEATRPVAGVRRSTGNSRRSAISRSHLIGESQNPVSRRREAPTGRQQRERKFPKAKVQKARFADTC